MSLLDVLLPVARRVAEAVKDSGLATEALNDVKALEGIAADHEGAVKAFAEQHLAAVETKVSDWLTERLQRYLPVPAPVAEPAPAPAEPVAVDTAAPAEVPAAEPAAAG